MAKQGKNKPRRRSASSTRARRRAKRIAILVVIAGAIGLYAFDHRAPVETVTGSVVSTRTYPHRSAQGEHTHTEAVIEYEGARHTLRRADGLTKGQSLSVDVRRGRLSGRLRFVALGESAPAAAGSLPGMFEPVAWEYDPIEDRYWHPIHGHWHDGRPPPPQDR